MPYKTLGELRSELRARLGFSAAGAAAGVNQEIINSFLSTAQVKLYWTHDWARLRRYEDKTVGLNQYLIDYPATANPERIKAISIKDIESGVFTPPIKKGIPPQLYTTQANTTRPARWEPYDQIEFWPKADKVYTARIFFVKNLDAFTQDAHRTTVDDGNVFLVALADAKAHYRQPDAKQYVEQAEALLNRLKAKSWGQTTFNPYDYTEETVLPKPVVV